MPSVPLPPEDRTRSPRTGWTRAHWEAVADGLLGAVRPHAGPEQALISLPGPRPSVSGARSDGLEGFARTFLLAAFRVAGAGGEDPHGLLEQYAAGLAAGTRTPTAERQLTAGDPVSWPVIGDRSQSMVESASVALGLRLTRPWLWDKLDGRTQSKVRAWLSGALHHTPADNNWWLFPFTVGAFLAETDDHAAAHAAVARGLQKIDQWYLGDGWYTDGRPRAFDHYNGWALHLYPVLHAHLSGDQALLDRYGSRLHAHLDGYASTFGADGAPMHQGRSLTYRFAATAPLWAGALTGHTPLAPGATRRLASGVLRHFLDHDALDADGLLTLGWYGPYLPVVQEYSGPASPYWASKGFLGLLLPADHPVWTDREAPAPVETGDAVVPLRGPGWLIQSTAADGLVRLHNHGSDNQLADQVLADDPLYARLAHSTATAPVHDGPPDNHFGLVVAGAPSERGRIRPRGAGPGWAASTHHPRIGGAALPGVRVLSLVLAHGPDEIHAHLVTGASPGTEARHSGWAAAGTGLAAHRRTDSGPASPGQVAEGSSGTVLGAQRRTDSSPAMTGHAATGLVAEGAAGAESAVAAGVLARVAATGADGRILVSELRGEIGFRTAAVEPVPAGTAFGPEAAVPVLRGTTGPGASLFVAAARLSAATVPTGAPLVQVRSRDDLHELHVRWPDGAEHEAVLHDAAAQADACVVEVALARPGGMR
ncbi:DUF2264 domain-containing protein [Streptacidiphilus jiangxiensis]|uniref:DUF2264 domain-containing protein n=1 Tax=Streptacidiphilus jiangxiensis TaxID=235985 RepID=A0A1H7NDP0_STRJI|nr:DUF2264 domain-containing protein [Streptacidiphilus jiangxiensis]SEL21078.1 hypothetical protein SAMN05414137_106312 [Streptacidiphilus jiangxiensis]